jgi:hypothetical protein
MDRNFAPVAGAVQSARRNKARGEGCEPERADAIKSRPARVCPLICDHGYSVEGESCVKITCGTGFFINDDNACEKKREKPHGRQRGLARQRVRRTAVAQSICEPTKASARHDIRLAGISTFTTTDVHSLDDMTPDQAYFNLPPLRAAA